MPIMSVPFSAQSAIEPMQLDAVEDNENNEELHLLVENPTLDLETYANAYCGLPKIYRLIFVADVCPSYRVEALKMAINHVLTTYNVNMYQVLFKKLSDCLGQNGRNNNNANCVPTSTLPDIASTSTYNSPFNTNMNMSPSSSSMPAQPSQSTSSNNNNNNNNNNTNTLDLPVYDHSWVESKTKKSALKLEKLDSDLKNYKSNSIKESIRRGHDDLGDHYLNCGDLSNALKCYSRARDYCTSGKHVVNMCLNVIKVSLYLQNWSHVLSYVSKAESTPDFSESNKDGCGQVIFTRLKCAAGVAELQMKKYKAAAKSFLFCHFDHCEYPEMLSPNNVAIYGGLCALATFDRSELQRLVLGSSSFKLFLELEPQLRDIIYKFYDSKYASCLTMLSEMRENLMLDMYLAPHLNSLYTKIRNRALVQYFSPYLSADMRKMGAAFNVTVSQLENEIMQLILDGQIQARIDSHSKILYRKEADQRSVTFERALNMGKEYQRRARMLLVRAAMQKANIFVKSPDINVGPGSSLSSITMNNVRI